MNKRIIVIDDEESILKDYLLILSPPEGNISELEKKAAALEAELFGETSEEEKPTQEYYELTTVSQGKKGFARVKEAREKMCPFALAFLDIRMPTDGKYSELFKIRRPF